MADVQPLAGADDARLTPQTPVTLTLDAGEGRSIERTISS